MVDYGPFGGARFSKPLWPQRLRHAQAAVKQEGNSQDAEAGVRRKQEFRWKACPTTRAYKRRNDAIARSYHLRNYERSRDSHVDQRHCGGFSGGPPDERRSSVATAGSRRIRSRRASAIRTTLRKTATRRRTARATHW